MSYQRYKGKSKYHFRYYRKTKYHPFLVVLVTNENGNGGDVKISGFNMTSSTLKFLERPSRFIKLDKNPNPETDAESYVSIDTLKINQQSGSQDQLEDGNYQKKMKIRSTNYWKKRKMTQRVIIS